MSNFDPTNSFGNTYIATTRDFQQDENNLRLLLNQSYIEIANSLNLKSNGVFETIETQNGEQFFGNTDNQQKKRYAFRKVFTIDPIAPGATLTFAHNITGVTQFTHIYGVINTAADSRPLPYVDVVNVTNQVSLSVTATNIVITSGATATAITGGIVVLEYLKS